MISNPPERIDYKRLLQQGSVPSDPLPSQIMTFSGSGLNDLTVGGSYNQMTIATFVITISATGTPDKIDWTETGGSGSSGSGVNLTSTAMTLADGVTITPAATTGHHAGDSWTIVATPVGEMFMASGGTAKVRWSNATTTTVGPDLASPGPIGGTTPDDITGNNIAALQSLYTRAGADATVALQVHGATDHGQSGHLVDFYQWVFSGSWTDTVKSFVDKDGSFNGVIGATTPAAATVTTLAAAATSITGTSDTVQLKIKGNSTQNTDLFQILDNSNHLFFSINGSGQLTLSQTGTQEKAIINGGAGGAFFGVAHRTGWVDTVDVNDLIVGSPFLFNSTIISADNGQIINRLGIFSNATQISDLNSNTNPIPDASVLLELQSTTRGFVPPSMTTMQRNAITSPKAGLMVFDTTLNHPFYFNGTIWVQV